jgi:uncharacterized repeat protein (TIGR03803 family)
MVAGLPHCIGSHRCQLWISLSFPSTTTELSRRPPYSFRSSSAPHGELVLFENTLYGTTPGGSDGGSGTVFAINTDGSGFRVLHTFTAVKGLKATNQDGAFPQDGLILSGHTLYGAAAGGGSAGNGTIFSISLPVTPPELSITPSGTNVILSWTTNATDFMLQSTTDLLSAPGWATVSPGPIVISGQNMVTNAIAVPQQFFRLSQ